MDNNEIRVLIAKPGLDGHDRGAKVITRYLSEQNIKTKFSGIRKTPEQITELAAKMDANIIGISILSGAHVAIIPRIMEMLEEQDMGDVLVILGGIIPEDDREYLRGIGVTAIFGPGTATFEIVDYIKSALNDVH